MWRELCRNLSLRLYGVPHLLAVMRTFGIIFILIVFYRSDRVWHRDFWLVAVNVLLSLRMAILLIGYYVISRCSSIDFLSHYIE